MSFKRIIAFLLIFALVFTSVNIPGKVVKAYDYDYNYVDNYFNEVGYRPYYDDTRTLDEAKYDYVGSFSSNMGDTFPADFYYSTYTKSNSLGISAKKAITPLNKEQYSTLPYNVNFIKTKKGLTEEEAIAWLQKDFEDNKVNQDVFANLRSSSTFYYHNKNNYSSSKSTISGNNLMLVDVGDTVCTKMVVNCEDCSQISDYCMAYSPNLKEFSFTNLNYASGVSFAKGCCYGCTGLKYLSYPSGESPLRFEDFAFANCSSLVHIMGKDGMTEVDVNFINSTYDDSYSYGKFAFAGCTAVTSINILSDNVFFDDYAFGQSGITYIGLYDYVGSDVNTEYLERARHLVANANSNFSDKAFDSVSATRIYTGHKDIYDVLNANYSDGLIATKKLAVANIRVTYDSKDTTSGTMEDVVIRYNNDTYTIVNKFKKDGYTFLNWENDEGAEFQDIYNAPHNGVDWIDGLNVYNGLTSIRPVWEANLYTITYYLNGGVVAENTELPTTRSYGEAITTLPEPIKVGNDFLGWFEDAALTIPFNGIPATDTSNHTYYAKWSKHDITITYVLDGGTNNPNNPTTVADNVTRFRLLPATREGYEFIGWSTSDKEEDIITYYQGSMGDVTLTALWKTAQYKLHYVLNGGDSSSVELPEYHTYGEAIVELPSPTRVGYKFVGWYEDENLTKEFSGILASDKVEHTYYAKWTENSSFVITYHLEGGINNPKNPHIMTADDGKVYLLPATREGYDFGGWTTGESDNLVTYVTAAMGDLDLYAIWSTAIYSITYELNGGTDEGITLPTEHKYGEAISSLDTPKRVGYDFGGWYEDEGLTIPFSGISTTDKNDHKYYAKWNKHDITITYILNGGVNASENPTSLSSNSSRVELKDPVRPGYDFTGWTRLASGDSNSASAEKVTFILAADGDQTLVANWEPHTYSITYELSGGEIVSGDAPTSYVYGTTTYLLISPVKTDCSFYGWFLDQDFKTRVYEISDTMYGDLTLFACYDDTVSSLDIPEKEGYRFVSWVDKEGNEIAGSEKISDYVDNIFARYLDIRWTTSKKGSDDYITNLVQCYDWYAKKEKSGDKASLTAPAFDGSFTVYGVNDGFVTKNNASINISGAITSVSLTKDGKKIDLDSSYFDNRQSGEYFKGYTCDSSGIYTLTVTSSTASKTIIFMVDKASPVVKGTAINIVTAHSRAKSNKHTKNIFKKGNKTVVTTIYKKKKTVVTTKANTFKVTQNRRMYVNKVKNGSKTIQDKAKFTWSDSVAGVSSIYINGKKLSDKQKEKGYCYLTKHKTYKIKVYDYLGNLTSHSLIVSKKKDVTLPSANVKNGKTYYAPCTLVAKDKSGIKKITVTDSHNFKKTVKKSKYRFTSAGSYTIRITDKVGNYRTLKIKLIKKKKY